MAVSAEGSVPASLRMPSLVQLSEAVIAKLRDRQPSRRNVLTSTEEGAQTAVNKLVPILDNLGEYRDVVREVYDAISQVTAESYYPGIGTPLVKNFEQWLSYLIDSPPWLSSAEILRNRAAFYEISQAVYDVLHERQLVTVVAQKECPKWLAQLVHYWDRERSQVLTFNYDRFVELAWMVGVGPKPPRTQPWDLYPTPLTPLNATTGTPPVKCDPHKFQTVQNARLDWLVVFRPRQPAERHRLRPGPEWFRLECPGVLRLRAI